MRHHENEPGCVHDTLLFLRYYLEETAGPQAPPDNPHYRAIKARLEGSGKTIPLFLYPLILRRDGRLSFLDMLLFDDRAFEQCTLKQVSITLNNQGYLSRRFHEYFFPGHDMGTARNKLHAAPGGLEYIKGFAFAPELELYIYYIAIHLEEAAEALKTAFGDVHAEAEAEQTAFMTDKPEFAAKLAPDSSAVAKLRAISGAQDGIAHPYRFSLTLLEPGAILFHADDPAYYLLGCEYAAVLEAKHKYADVTPFTFAQAIGNEAKYEIYQALTKRGSMTRGELEMTLRMSRSEVEYNLDGMRDKGLVIVDRQQGNAYYYKINPEYIRVVTNILLGGIA